MKNLQFNFYQCGVGWRWGEIGWVGSKKSKPIPILRCRAKILPYPYPTTFAGRGKPAWGEVGKGGSSERGQAGLRKIAISSYCVFALFFILLNCETHKKLKTEAACNLLSCFILSLVRRDNNNCKYRKIRVARHGVRSIMCC